MSRETFWNLTATLLGRAIGMLILVKLKINLKMYVEVKRCLLETSKKYKYEVSIERYE